MNETPVIHIVDDDTNVRESLSALLGAAGFEVRAYSSAREFLAHHPWKRGCLILDICMPGMDGLALQEEIIRLGIDLPIIVMTGHGDVSTAVRAMKAGALDFIEKPFADEILFKSVDAALKINERENDRLIEAETARRALNLLTPRERNVLEQLVAGQTNKGAAREMGISPRTIEVHRARIMSKLKANSLSDLVRAALAGARRNERAA
jgi:two-component system response regulator FixJ